MTAIQDHAFFDLDRFCVAGSDRMKYRSRTAGLCCSTSISHSEQELASHVRVVLEKEEGGRASWPHASVFVCGESSEQERKRLL